MRLFRTVTRAAGISLCVVAFAGTAAAGNGGDECEKGDEGKSEAAHVQKSDRAQAAASSESQSQAGAKADVDAEAKAETGTQAATKGQSKGQAKAEAKAAVKAAVKATVKSPVAVAVTSGGSTEVKAQAKAQEKAAHASQQAAEAQAKVAARAAVKASVVTNVAAKAAAKQAAKAQIQAQAGGRSAEAHRHVIICHRTGSDSNPYVVINIPTTAWNEAHSDTTGKHPAKNGREDKLLKNPASRPGSKDGFTKQSSCGAAPAVVQTTVQESDVCPNIAGMQTTVPAGTVKHGNGACAETKTEVSVTAQPTVTEVAAVQTKAQVKAQVKAAKGQAKAQAKAAQQAQAQPASGVLGAVASAPEAIQETATSGTLPFTGIPLWVTVLLGSGLLLTGLALRRAAQH